MGGAGGCHDLDFMIFEFIKLNDSHETKDVLHSSLDAFKNKAIPPIS